MVETLSERLRVSQKTHTLPDGGDWRILGEAAARLEAFERENAELRDRVHYAEGTADTNIQRAEAAERRNAELEAQLAKATDPAYLEEKLRQIGITDDIARAALAGSGGGWPVPEGYALVPVEPTRGRLISMAIRHNHAFLVNHDPNAKWTSGVTKEHRESVLRSMRQLYEEAVGMGFYSPDREDSYVSSFEKAQAAAPEAIRSLLKEPEGNA